MKKPAPQTDHRAQIERADTRRAKKKMRKSRRTLDQKLCEDDESNPVDVCTMTSDPPQGGIYKNHTFGKK